MRTLTAEEIAGKTVLLRMDLDVPFKPLPGHETFTAEGAEGDTTTHLMVAEDFRLLAGVDTLDFCLEHAKSVIVMGHIGRPEGKEDSALSVAPIVDWFETQLKGVEFPAGKFHILENLRFEPGEDSADPAFAQQLANLGDFYINEAFASHHPAASTTVLPGLLPHAAGFRFAKEVEVLTKVLNNPQKPLVAVIGGAKLEDKLSVVNRLSQIADAVLLGGKLIHEVRDKGMSFASNVIVGRPSDDGFDISPETRHQFEGVVSRAKQVIWSGPMGKFEDGHNQGNQAIVDAIVASGASSIVGGGDTIAALVQLDLLDKFAKSGFVSVGGGAMLKLLATGTLPTIEALN